MKLVIDLGLLALVGAAAVHQWGWLPGLGSVAAIYLIMPYQVVDRG